MKFNNIKAILFDSGRVLNYPRIGNWFISPKIFEFIDRDIFDRVKDLDINRAFRKAYDYIEKELGISPAQTLFIDDNYSNCQGAEELGINSIVLDRDKSYNEQVESISSLDELVKILD